MQSWGLILIGFILSLLGVALPFLMVIHVLESTFFLNFLSFGLSVLGILLGIPAAALYNTQKKKRKNDDNY